ncbi:MULTISPECIES: acyl-CoA dehydrogenase family protein [Streptomyces]|uniref:acyl-CoA dehydrogenase family protein n=1 Tax=Streptomyces TaxID=1883 RepID=UPI001D132561|nr:MULTISPECIES: acyl-CoA dehydrogenase family protein [Streptomyces]
MGITEELGTAPAEDELLGSVREFIDREVVPHADAWDREERLPAEVLRRVGELGLWAPFLPHGHGGRALPMSTLARLHEEVGRGCSSVRSLLTVHGMVSWSVHHWGTDEQRARWLPRLADGSLLGSFGLTGHESGTGADVSGTTATPDGDDWLLTGRKKWITGGQLAGLYLVFAQAGGGMTAFLVPREAPGVSVTPLSNVLGTRASHLAEIRFEEVRLPADAVLGPLGWAAGTVMTSALDLGRLSVASGCVGIIQACLDASVAHTRTRMTADGPLFDRQLVRRKISDMVTGLRTARLLCRDAARLKDAEDPGMIMANMVAKYHASTAAASCADAAVQLHGAAGCSQEHPVARLYRDARVMEIIEGSTELQQITIAEQAHQEVTR